MKRWPTSTHTHTPPYLANDANVDRHKHIGAAARGSILRRGLAHHKLDLLADNEDVAALDVARKHLEVLALGAAAVLVLLVGRRVALAAGRHVARGERVTIGRDVAVALCRREPADLAARRVDCGVFVVVVLLSAAVGKKAQRQMMTRLSTCIVLTVRPVRTILVDSLGGTAV